MTKNSDVLNNLYLYMYKTNCGEHFDNLDFLMDMSGQL